MSIKRPIIWSIIGTGISSVAVQLVTIREFLSHFHGNEITISLVLFSWLLLTGLGTLAAKFVRRSSLTVYTLITLFIALWPLLQMIIIRGFREVVFVHGASPGFHHIFFYLLATTAPYCFLVGFALPYSLEVLQDHGYPFTAGQLYLTDSIGDILSGALFGFVLVYWMKPFKTIAVTSTLLIVVAFLLLIRSRKRLLLAPAVLASFFSIFFP